MRAWARVLAAACAAALCTPAAAADHDRAEKPLAGRALEFQQMTDQMPALSQLREVKPESLQVISSKLPTSQAQSLSDSETTLRTAAAAVSPEGVKQPLFRGDLQPQHMMEQLPALSQLREVKPESLQVISSKPPTLQTQSLPDSETTLSTAAATVSPEGVKQPLLGRSLDPQHMMQQLPALSPPREVTSELLQVISSKPPTPQTRSLSMSDIALSAEESGTHDEVMKHSALVKDQKPQRMLGQMSEQIRYSETHKSSQFSSQFAEDLPPQPKTHSRPPENTGELKSSTQAAHKSSSQQLSQSSSETHLPQYMSAPPQPLPRTVDSGKKCNCFHELPQRKWLDCSSLNRTTIRADELCVFTTHVNLSHNSFVSLPENLGDNVRSLNLSHNLLTAIPRSPPLHPSMHTLDLSFNRITNSSNELEDMSYLRLLYVQGNHLQSLNFLPKACSLHTLLASHNQLRSLEGPLYYCFMAVEIDVSWNPLNELSKTDFENLFNLRRLHLVHLGLTSLPPGFFGRSAFLRFVDLSENKLTTLPARAFDGWSIETILLDKNIISYLPNDTFSKLLPYTIKKISLAQNKLKNIPQGLFSELWKLQHLNLNQNYLQYIPNGIFDGSNLTEIYLQSNLLEKLPPRLFSGLKNLKRIDLGGNQLASVPDDLLADLSNLELLDLSDNLLTTVTDGFFNGVKSIEVLDLSSNLLSSFSGSQLEGLDHVEWLYLKGNQLKELPVFDATWPQVVRFTLERNQIEELSEEAVRSWLGDGSEARRVTLGGRQWLRSVVSLRWVVNDPNVTAIVDVADCRCGFVNRGRAHLFFCASVWCPGDVANWVDAASHTDNAQTAP